jgi:hypothetical protein
VRFYNAQINTTTAASVSKNPVAHPLFCCGDLLCPL